jgi:hypothetical protein
MSFIKDSIIKNPKSAIALSIYLSKIDGKVFAAIDGNKIDIELFGIDLEKFIIIKNEIENIIQKIFQNGINDYSNIIPESKL